VLKNGIYNSLGGVIRVGAAALSTPILIHLMGLEEYGLWALVTSTLGFVTIAEAGLPVSTTVFISQDLSKQDRQSFSQTLSISICGMIVLASGASLLLWANAASVVRLFPQLNLQDQQTVIQALQFGAIGVWAQLIQQVCVGVEQAYQEYRLMSILKTLPWVFFAGGWIVIAWLGGNAIALAQWQAAISVLALAGHFWLLRSLVKEHFVGICWSKSHGFKIAKYSSMAWVTNLGGAVFTRCDRLLVGAILGSTKLGLYTVISDFSGAINFFSAQPIQPILPTISYLSANPSTDKKLLQQKVKEATEINCFVATLAGAVLVTLAPKIVHVILPREADYIVLAFQALIIITTLCSLNAVGYFILFSQDVKKASIIQTVAGFLSIFLVALGCQYLDFLGVALGNAGYLITLLMPIIAARKLGLSHNLLWRWIALPTSIFVGVSLFSIVFSNQQLVLVSLLVLQVLINCLWIGFVYRSQIQRNAYAFHQKLRLKK
jgi:O-antigen/teichoic acid export membrane protein